MTWSLRPISVDPLAIPITRHWSLNQDVSLEVEQSLLDSIERFTIIHPPILRTFGKSYDILCGVNRIAAAQQLALSQITCLAVDHPGEVADLLLLIAEDQRLSGPLSPIQSARLIAMAESCAPHRDHRFIKQLLAASGTVGIHRLKPLLSLEEAIRNSIHNGQCSVHTGLAMVDMIETDRITLFQLLSNLSLNANRQRRVIELSRIIAAGRQCSIGDVFQTDFPELLELPIDNIPQKSSLLIKELFRLSHPLSSQAEERFTERVKGLKLPAHIRLTHSPSFERDTVTMEVDFAGLEDFEQRWQRLKKNWD